MDLLTIHLTTLAMTAIAILYADHLGYQYFRGHRATLDANLTGRLHTIVLIGLLLMIVTGVLLTIPIWEYVKDEPIFYVKMGIVLVLVLNSWAIGQLSGQTAEHPFLELPRKTQAILLTSGALSFAGWVGATTLSFFFF